MRYYKRFFLALILAACSVSISLSLSSCNSSTTAANPKDTVAPFIYYTYPSLQAIQGVAIIPDTVRAAGGMVTSYSVSPALPSGLVLNSQTGLITGTPASAAAAVTDTIVATGPGGVGRTEIVIAVTNPNIAPSISYKVASLTAYYGAAIVPDTVISTGGTVTRYSVTPALPAGLSLNAATGLITGTTSSQPLASMSDTVIASGPGGVASTVVVVTVLDTTGGSYSLELSPVRRVYVNDPAINDSLIMALARPNSDSGGVVFVMQPGQMYHLRLATASTGDKISLYGYTGSSVLSFGNVAPTLSSNNDTEIFTLQSNQSQATWFAGILQAPDGINAASRISHVSMVSLNTVPSTDTIRVNLIMVGNLSAAGLNDSAQKVAFANAFLTELGTIYQGVNNLGFSTPITFIGSYSIAAPESAAAVVNFGPGFVPLSGTRVANAANLYLVSSISYAGLSSSESILGFSPREVVDMSTDDDSRIVLNASAAAGSAGATTITQGIPALATTTAHELGHFFGLRHPTATAIDLDNDNDQSNFDDGLGDTPVCSELTKTGAEHIVTTAYNKRAYCLFIATQEGCPSDCDYENLMFAYSCAGSQSAAQAQRQVTPDQQALFLKNLALLQGK